MDLRERKIRKEIEKLQNELEFITTEEVIMDRVLCGHVETTKDNIEVGFKRKKDTGAKNKVNYRLIAKRKGRTITCTLCNISGNIIYGIGKSTCNSNDKFDDRIGFELAQLRAKVDWHNRSLNSYMTRHGLK